MIEIFHQDTPVASFIKEGHDYTIVYNDFTLPNSISLSLPNTKKLYHYTYRFPPFLESFLPEGYLYEVFKNLLTKEYGYIDDYLIFSRLAPNIQSRITFESDFKKGEFDFLDIDTILENDSHDTFERLLRMFLDKNAVSGVQPKTVALLKDKSALHLRQYIVKTWGDEYPYLAENEYFCLKACEKAGLQIPHIQLSKNKRFLLVENFIFQSENVFGFEEILSLMDKNRDQKYSGSYEQVAKIIYQYTTHKKSALRTYYQMIVMNYLLRNGDAHLKNFGLLFHDDFSHIALAPTYDVVNTTCYIYKDKPALMLDGQKVWHDQNALVDFGTTSCLLSTKEAVSIYQSCIEALLQTIEDIRRYIQNNPHFEDIGTKMIDSFHTSLENKTIKGLSDELIRAWR
jgi:serine/threonine-protein kinase HipA